ncbi:MAG: glycosyltransferase family 39 protein, partial [Myxococcota bacterium]
MPDSLRKMGLSLAKLAVLAIFAGYVFGWSWPDVFHGELLLTFGVWAGATGLFALIGPTPFVTLSRWLERIPPWIFGPAVVLGVGVLCTVIATGPYEAVPRVQDEVNYYFQGKILASGEFFVPSHDLADFFTVRFFVNDGQMFSLFQAGWPALMAIGHLLDAPAYVAPVVTAISTGFFFGSARRILGEATGRWATLMLAATAVFIFQGASMMSHGAAAMCGLGMLYFATRYWEERSPAFAVVAGAFLGYMFTVRAGTAVGMGAPMGLAMVYLWWNDELDWTAFAWAALGFVPTASLQFWYNWTLSGDILSFPQDRYFHLTEPVPDCHRLGIGDGIGCPREHGPDLGPDGFTWARAVEVTQIRFAQFRWDLFGTGLGILLISLPFFTDRVGRYKYLLVGFLLGLVGLYFFYYYHGNCFGARYYFEAVPACIMLIAAGWGGLFEAARDLDGVPAAVRRIACGAVVAGALLFPGYSAAVEFPNLWERYGPGYWGVDRSVINTVEEENIDNAVVVLANRNDKHYRIGFFLNDPELEGDVLFVRDFGKQNAQLKTYYPEREFYAFYRTGQSEGRLRKLNLEPTPERVFIEAESKFPALRRASAYATVQ